jgi:acyl-coenzyme A thioesterase PaaI-like protein
VSPLPTAWPSSPTSPPPDVEPAVRAPGRPAPGEVLGTHYADCFGCGDRHPTGLHLQVTAGEGVRVHARFQVTENHQGAPGLAHGGLLATAFDEALGYLPWLLDVPAVTGRLETDYLLPVPVGATLVMDCECLGRQRRKVYVRGEARLDGADGPVAVRASALFVAVPLDHFTMYGRPTDRPAERSFHP